MVEGSQNAAPPKSTLTHEASVVLSDFISCEMAGMHVIYGDVNDNGRAALRLYQECFPCRHMPNHKMVHLSPVQWKRTSYTAPRRNQATITKLGKNVVWSTYCATTMKYDRPARSPDLSPNSGRAGKATAAVLIAQMQRLWQDLPQGVISDLIESMPRRISACKLPEVALLLTDF
ncbi:hypothetical protein TNCV_4383591 [Trichonephila clavipes]|nr:hypothetical protein TNCV_4383591 [Trichonephila clavipes]